MSTIAYIINLYLLKSNWLISQKTISHNFHGSCGRHVYKDNYKAVYAFCTARSLLYTIYDQANIYRCNCVYPKNSNIDLIEQPIGRILPPVPVVFKAAVHP